MWRCWEFCDVMWRFMRITVAALTGRRGKLDLPRKFQISNKRLPRSWIDPASRTIISCTESVTVQEIRFIFNPGRAYLHSVLFVWGDVFSE